MHGVAMLYTFKKTLIVVLLIKLRKLGKLSSHINFHLDKKKDKWRMSAGNYGVVIVA